MQTGIAKKLLFRVLLVMIVVSSATVFSLIYSAYQLEKNNRDTSVRYAISNLTPILGNILWTYELEKLGDLVDAFLRNPHINGVSIKNETDQDIKSDGDVADFPELSGTKSIQVKTENNRLVYQVPVFKEINQETTLVGYLQLSAPDDVIIKQIEPIIKLIVLTSLISLTLLAIVFYWVQKSTVAEPVKALTSEIIKISAHIDSGINSTPQVASLQNSNDEIGELFRSFYEMHDELIERNKQVQTYQKNLEGLVAKRTAELHKSNSELEGSLIKLKIAQKELVEQEKMASLGGLVSGVAHEVNTPLGVSITAITHLEHEIDQFEKSIISGQIKKSSLERIVEESKEGIKIIFFNLKRAASLVQNFKEVAVDQTTEEKRNIDISGYIQEILTSLYPKFKKSAVKIETDLEENILLNTYPGTIAQIVTNLLMNSLIHAFDHGKLEGVVKLKLSAEEDKVILTVADNGKGMDQETSNKVFEPFFTTQRASGGTGLGMHIVYNLVKQKLFGKITCESSPGKGTEIVITFNKT